VPDHRDDDFFVGYLPTPPRLGWLLRTMVVAGLVLALVLAGALAARQRDPGLGTWDPDDTQTFEGVFRATPYPMLEMDDNKAGRPYSMLIIDQGKLGGSRVATEADGARVKVRGQPLKRGMLTLLELADEPNPLTLIGTGAPAVVGVRTNLQSTLKGEIIDPKCYAGAMKPGDGKTHKACAALCIRGGMPPVLITGSDPRAFVLTDVAGGPLRGEDLDRVAAVVGEPVSVKGVSLEVGGIWFLRVDTSMILRR
jgi:hypothetical protein